LLLLGDIGLRRCLATQSLDATPARGPSQQKPEPAGRAATFKK
jgi:hypothetical protein